MKHDTSRDYELEHFLITIGLIAIVIASIAFVCTIIGLILKFICMTAWISVPLIVAAGCFGAVHYLDDSNKKPEEYEGPYVSENNKDF